MRTLSRAVSSGLKPTPSSMNGDIRPSTATVPAVLPVDAGEDLQQRALAAAVRADDPEELALLDREETSSSASLLLVGRAVERVEEVLLERRCGSRAAAGTSSRRRRPRSPAVIRPAPRTAARRAGRARGRSEDAKRDRDGISRARRVRTSGGDRAVRLVWKTTTARMSCMHLYKRVQECDRLEPGRQECRPGT